MTAGTARARRAPVRRAPLPAPLRRQASAGMRDVVAIGDARRRQREIAARRIVLARKRRDEPAVAQVLGDHRQTPERHALPADRGLHDLVVDPESQRTRRLQSRLAVRREPAAPVEPRRASVGIVQVQQHVVREVGRRAQVRCAARDFRTRDRGHPFAEEAHRCSGAADRAGSEPRRRRRRARGRQAIVGGHVDLDVRMMRAKRGEPRNDPQRRERYRGRQRQARRSVDAPRARSAAVANAAARR